MSHSSPHAAGACANCGSAEIGEYCQQCGEKRFDEHNFSVGHFVHDATHEFLHVDSKILSTFWLLFSKPGFLTAEYWRGRQGHYIRPLRLYIIVAALHLLVLSGTVLRFDFFRANDESGALARLMQRIATSQHSTPEAVQALADTKLQKILSVTQYGGVLGFALVPWLLYRKRRPYYVQHLIFSLHLFAAYYLLSMLLSTVLGVELWRKGPGIGVSLVFLCLSLKRLYEDSWPLTIGKAIVLRGGMFLAELVSIGIAVGGALLWLALGGSH